MTSILIVCVLCLCVCAMLWGPVKRWRRRLQQEREQTTLKQEQADLELKLAQERVDRALAELIRATERMHTADAALQSALNPNNHDIKLN